MKKELLELKTKFENSRNEYEKAKALFCGKDVWMDAIPKVLKSHGFNTKKIQTNRDDIELAHCYTLAINDNLWYEVDILPQDYYKESGVGFYVYYIKDGRKELKYNVFHREEIIEAIEFIENYSRIIKIVDRIKNGNN